MNGTLAASRSGSHPAGSRGIPTCGRRQTSTSREAQGRTDRRDDRAAHSDRHERAPEARPEEHRTEPREQDQLDTDDAHRDGDRDLVVADQNGRVWKTPPTNVPPPVIPPRTNGLPLPVRSPVSDSPSENAMLTPAPSAVASPVKNAVSGWCVASTTAKMGASVESEPSIRPLNAGWTR